MIDLDRVKEIYLSNDVDHGITLKHFEELAEKIYNDGYGEGYSEGWDDCFDTYGCGEK